MESKASVKRRLILNTAKKIILDGGLNSLTLDAVAKNAEISKGGLLYHFPNKESLLTGLAQYIFDDFSFHFYQFAENDPNETGRWTRALINASRHDLEHNGELNVGIHSASFLEPEIAVNISQSYKDILLKLEDDKITPLTSTIIRLALDGLYYAQVFNVAPLEKEKINEVIQQLLEVTKSGGS